MTSPRFRQHADGRWAFKAGPYQFWTVIAADGAFDRDLPDAAMTAQQGWTEAVLVTRVPPVPVARASWCRTAVSVVRGGAS